MDFLNLVVSILVLWWVLNKAAICSALTTRSKTRMNTPSNYTLTAILKDFEDQLIVDMTSSSELAMTSQQVAFLRSRFVELNKAVRRWRHHDNKHRKRQQQQQQQTVGLNEPTVRSREASRQQALKSSSTLPVTVVTTPLPKQADNWWSASDQRRRRPASSGRQQKTRHHPHRPSFDWDVVQYPSCPSRTQLVQLRTAVDINNVVVTVYQPSSVSLSDEPSPSSNGGRPLRLPAGAGGAQWFHTITCYNQSAQSPTSSSSSSSSVIVSDCPNCCIGVDHSRFASSCQQKQSHVMAVVRRPGEDYVWNWIRVDSSCSCAIAPLNPSSSRH